MRPSRRRFLILGGGVCATLSLSGVARAAQTHTIEMTGTDRGERVWFAPRGLAVDPGATIRWVNRDPGNSHTATAYHPDYFGRDRRIPAAATPWDSGFLLPGDEFEVTLRVPGVYDYYCLPHEMALMVGRIVVGRPDTPGWEGPAPETGDIAPEVYAALPTVEEIVEHGHVGEAPR